MENKTYLIDNSNYLTLDGSPSIIKIIEGHGYVFLIRKHKDGTTGARHEVGNYSQGEEFLNLKGTEKYDFILTGLNGAKIQVINLIAMEMMGCAAANRNSLWVDYDKLVGAAEETGHPLRIRRGYDRGPAWSGCGNVHGRIPGRVLRSDERVPGRA